MYLSIFLTIYLYIYIKDDIFLIIDYIKVSRVPLLIEYGAHISESNFKMKKKIVLF